MAERSNLSSGARSFAASGPGGHSAPSDDAFAYPEPRAAESDVADLAAKFYEHSGGGLSPESAAELALDIVLHELVQQACLATGASGAAIVLRSGAEMVCRATTGPCAPPLGARMNISSGLSGLCIQTGQVQRCDDTQTDPRADSEASQRLGARSLMVFPLARPTSVLGVIEIFSTRPSAFGDRDEQTLQAIAVRILRNVERAAAPILLPGRRTTVAEEEVGGNGLSSSGLRPPVPSSPASYGSSNAGYANSSYGPAKSGYASPSYADLPVPTFGQVNDPPRRGLDIVTWVLALLVLGSLVLMGVLASRRLGLNTDTEAESAPASAAAQRASGPTQAKAKTVPTGSAKAASASPPVATAQPQGVNPAGHWQSASPSSPEPSVGGLQVFENGKEVFRLPPSSAHDQGPRVVHLSSAYATEDLIHRVDPEYPEQARMQHVEGKVLLTIRIRPDGSVGDVQLNKGDPLLSQAAIDAVMQWRFKALAETDAAAERQTQVTLDFRLP